MGLSWWINLRDNLSEGFNDILSDINSIASFTVGIEFGPKTDSFWRLNVAAGGKQQIGDYFSANYEAGFSIYTGGIGTLISKTGTGLLDFSNISYDIYGSVSGTGGVDEYTEMPLYPFNTMVQSPVMDTYDKSFTYGLTWYYNKLLNEVTQSGFLNLRWHNWSISTHNDLQEISRASRSTDQGWTGGMNLTYWSKEINSWFELGNETFTNKRDTRERYDIGERSITYLDKTKDIYNTSRFTYGDDINRAETFWRIRSAITNQEFTFGFSWRAWLQDILHSSEFFHGTDDYRKQPALFDYPITKEKPNGCRFWMMGGIPLH